MREISTGLDFIGFPHFFQGIFKGVTGFFFSDVYRSFRKNKPAQNNKTGYAAGYQGQTDGRYSEETERLQSERLQEIVQKDQGAATHQGDGTAKDGREPDGHEELAQRDLHGLADALYRWKKKGCGADVLHKA